MNDGHGRAPAARLLREPTVHFFILAALLFLGHRLIVGNPRVIAVSTGLRADLQRQLRDQNGRRPTPSELEAALDTWKRNEALYREAIRDGIDRDDPTVRLVLADRMRARAVQEMPKREPSDDDLARMLAGNRKAYEVPLQYSFDSVAFSKTETDAAKRRSGYQRALAAGAKPSTLGRPITSATLTRADLTERFGAALAASICGLPIGAFEPLETADSLLLVRLDKVEGGLPSQEELRPRLVNDWLTWLKQQAVEHTVEQIVARYRFEEVP